MVGWSAGADCSTANDVIAARVIRLDLGTQGVHARRLEPQTRPVGEVAAARHLELGEQVGEGRVAPLVLVEVGGNPGEERVDAHPRDELLQHRAALGVGDPVEVHLHVFEVVDRRNHGVRGGKLVLAVRPALLHRVERRPRLGPLGGLGGRDRRRPLGERLVQPQVVPPLHGHEVAEPHVGEFVQDRDDAALAHGIRHLRPEHVELGERHRTRILHRSRVVLGHEELVVLRERVGHPELRLEVRRSPAWSSRRCSRRRGTARGSCG